MKKFISLVLCLIFVFSFTACAEEEKASEQKHTVDIEYYAKLGQISDLEYKLGDNVEDTKELLNKTTDDHGETNYFDYESGEYTIMTNGNVYCCYKTENEDTGITHIVKNGDAYGFTVGAVSTQVRDAMKTLGFDATERKAERSEIFFLPAGADMTVLEYKFGDTTVLFVFQQNALCATVISK